MKNRLLLFALILFTGTASAQIVGTDCFLMGRWLEVGVNQMGGFGTCTSPASYHTHGCPYTFAPPLTVGAQMDASYDWGHDGWTVAVPATAPACMGPYTQPGYPQEGWSIQVGATEYRNGGWGGACSGSFAVPGGHTGYSAVSGNKTDFWEGNIVGLNIKQRTRVDTLASWAVITTVIRNTTGAPIANVYYQRTNDPDNPSGWGGGSTTRNRIVHQNEDARHMVLVTSNSETGVFNATNSFMALGTKDCRARCAVITGLAPSSTPSAMWNAINSGSGGAGLAIFALGANNLNDQGMTLVYNLGTIAAFDSTVISYAYIYNNANGIDSAFPYPTLKVDTHAFVASIPPNAEYDTLDACIYGASVSTIPLDILYSEDGNWTWSKWTWAPGTGLSATTGSHLTLSLGSLPPSITYTITGTDSATGMSSCNNKVFYLTILTCNGATANAPCVGDTLKLNAPGDSTYATYKWYGPAPSTTLIGTTQSVNIFPATMAHNGTYIVVKTVGGMDDTATTDVHIFALPQVTLSSNIPPCGPLQNPLTLVCNTDSICTDWLWSGPAGFTSTLQNPSVTFDSSKAGIYVVTATSDHGCKNSNSINIKPGAQAKWTFDRRPGCPTDTLLITTNTSFNANTYTWNWGDGSAASTDRLPGMHLYATANKTYTVTLTVGNSNGCVDTEAHVIDLRHSVTADYQEVAADMTTPKDTICNGSPLIVKDLSTSSNASGPTSIVTYVWDFGDGHVDNAVGNPAPYTYQNEGVYPTKLTVTDNLGCTSTKIWNAWVLQPYLSGMSDTQVCLTQPLKLYSFIKVIPKVTYGDYGYTYTWTPPLNLSSSTIQEPFFKAIGQHNYTLTATMNRYGCQATKEFKINSILPMKLHHVTQDTRVNYGNSIRLNADSEKYYMWVPNDGSLDNPNINNPIATPTVTTTYTVYGMDGYGCRDTMSVTIHVDSTAAEFIPTGFTPNGDGKNDIFRVNGSRFNKMVEMRIYNRWGQQLFYTSSKEQGWDGTYNGEPQPMGTYYYTVICGRSGYSDNQVYKGEVTLIR